MKCPKCEEGTIIKIKFKHTEENAYLCDFCESLWFEKEDINSNPTHNLQSYSQGENLEYTIEDFDEEDQEHQPAEYKNYR